MTTADLVGQTVGKYRIEALLGSGGMGQVYRGVHVLLNRPAAIKVMHRQLAADPTFQARFRQEAKAAAALEHPNIVQIYDFGEENGRFYLVMELMTDGSVRTLVQQYVRQGQTMPLVLGLDLVRQAADGLAYAHTQGMVHRDIKPDNLLLKRLETGTGQQTHTVKVGDFGLARLAEGSGMTSPGTMMGTPAYMSPEQCQGVDLDGRSDLYSLGVVLYELTTGYLPFEVKTITDAVHKHIYTPPPPPRQVRPDLPAEVEQIILRCLAKRPEERFASAAELSAMLRSAVGATGAATMMGTPPPVPDLGQTGRVPIATPSQPRGQGTVLDAPASGETLPPGVPSLPGATGPVPRLHVLDGSGRTLQVVDVTDDGVTVGRRPDNAVVLEDEAVSRHHLRVDWDGSGVTVTDLGSSNGTLLAGSRLLPQVAQAWNPRDWVRVGPYWLRLEPPARPETRPIPGGGATVIRGQGAEPEVVESTRLRVLLEQDRLAITPGQPAIVKATLANMGSLVDHLAVTVEGVPAEWVRGPDREVQLNPGDQAPVVLQVNAPRAPESRAGEYPVVVRATSRKQPTESGAGHAVWTVLPFTESRLALEPVRAGGRRKAGYSVQLENCGNVGTTYTLSGKDEEKSLDFQFARETVTLDPAQADTVPLRVGAARRWIGNAQQRPFQIQSTSPTDPAPRVVAGQFVHKALIPTWAPPVALGLLALLAFLWTRLPGPGTPIIRDITFKPSAQVLAGEPVTAHWIVQDATSLEISPWGVTLDPERDTPQLSQDGTRVFTKTGTDGNTTFEVLAWNGVDGEDDAWTVEVRFPGGLNDSKEFTVIAWNGELSAEKQLKVEVAQPTPTPTPEPGAPDVREFQVSRKVVQVGETVTITWDVENAETVKLQPFGDVPPSGSRDEILFETTTFTLIADNGGKTAERSERVTVLTPTPTPMPSATETGGMGTGGGGGGMTPTTETTQSPEVELRADKTTIDEGQCAIVTWHVEWAESVAFDGAPVDFTGQKEVCPKTTTTYGLDVTALDGTTTDYGITIVVNPIGSKLDHFVGNWQNTDPNTSGITRFIVEKVNDTTATVHAFGKCTPNDCDWGTIEVPFTPGSGVLQGTYRFGFADTSFVAKRSGEQLVIETATDFVDPGRADYRASYTMERSIIIVDPIRRPTATAPVRAP